MEWNIKKSKRLYGVKYWGSGYYSIGENGNVYISPSKDSKRGLDLFHLIHDLKERGIAAPFVLRFPEIIKSQIKTLHRSFQKSIKQYGYTGSYKGVYPIKVNQEKHIVEEILRHGESFEIGLECGSKTELLIALALSHPRRGPIICNGFKDKTLIETALLSKKLGLNIIIVIDRIEELDLVIEISEKIHVQPKLGIRVKLDSTGTGHWSGSSGKKSKFGLTPEEIIFCIKKLKKKNMLKYLKMLHFHMGSQITSIQSIKNAITEGVRFYAEMHSLGTPLETIDVGGGLGIDYDGSGQSKSSINYTLQEYANDVVSIIQSICNEKNIPDPEIISESGRFMVAHSSVLIFEILNHDSLTKNSLDYTSSRKDSPIVKNLFEIYNTLDEENLNEHFNDLMGVKKDILQLFSYGSLSLEQRAKAESIFFSTASKIMNLAEKNEEYEDIFQTIKKELTDTYFANFSVFQSLPDSWALRQTFPVMPIQNLDKNPDKRVIIADLTCDSDGKISQFMDNDAGEFQDFIPLHDTQGKSYYVGTFLIGAYQEILGDLHNLFGDTNIVQIKTDSNNRYEIVHQIEGDNTYEILNYLEYQHDELIEKVRKMSEQAISKNQISKGEGKALVDNYKNVLFSYTYLEEKER